MIDLDLDRRDRGPLAPLSIAPTRDVERAGRRSATEPQRLRVVQITDPHLGPFMSPAQLAAICQRAVDAEPDLVLMTGDLLTMESHGAVGAIAAAFAPLAALPGRVFACYGNHDHEDPVSVRRGLERAGVRLLVDEWVRVQTRVGPVDVVGSDYHWRRPAEKLATLLDRPDDGTPRIPMLHNPSHVRHLPEGAADLIVSGQATSSAGTEPLAGSASGAPPGPSSRRVPGEP